MNRDPALFYAQRLQKMCEEERPDCEGCMFLKMEENGTFKYKVCAIAAPKRAWKDLKEVKL